MLDPKEIINSLDFKKDMLVAEFGCGSGNFILEVAKKIEEGKAYGLDIQEEPLSALEGRARAEGLINVETIRCDLEKEGGSGLPTDFLDWVLIPNLLFQIEKKITVLKEAYRILKPKGKMLIIDWKKEASFGPKQERVSEEEVKQLSQETGFVFLKEIPAGSFHFGLIFEKQ